jgi:hypothetical protein
MGSGSALCCAVGHAIWHSLHETSSLACVILTLNLRSGQSSQRDPKAQVEPIVPQNAICLLKNRQSGGTAPKDHIRSDTARSAAKDW